MKKVKISYEPPAGWETTLSKIQIMRENIVAPVDIIGCDKLATSVDEKTRR